MMSGSIEYIEFADPVIEALCATTWGDGVGLTYAQAAAVTSIPNNVFRGNTTITSFDEFQYFINCTTLSGGASGTGGFQNSSLTSITFPASLTTIGEAVFAGCTSLTTVTFCPTTALTLSKNVFNGCTALTSIDGIKIGNFNSYGCFEGCSSLTSVDLSTSTFTSLTGSGSSNTNGIFKNCSGLKTVVLPSICSSIGKAAFNGCTALETINLGNITNIASYSFHSTKLTGAYTLSSVTGIGGWAFYNNDSITEINCPLLTATDGTSTQNSGSFGHCSNLEYVDFGSSFTTLGQRTFDNCAKLSTFICRATSAPSFGANAFRNTNSSLKIYVPNGCGATYKAASGWSSYASKIYELDANGNIPT